MKKYVIMLILAVLAMHAVFAHNDLSDYPDILAESGKLEAAIVVGDKSSSSNVLAQIAIGSSIRDYKNDAKTSNKLSSEITSLDQNIISIGNPCINPVSASIMNNPQPCDKDFPKGKAYIRLFTKDEFHHIIVAGYSDSGTRKAADILADFKNQDFDDSEYEIKIEDEIEEAAYSAGSVEQEPKADESIKSDSQSPATDAGKNEISSKNANEEENIEITPSMNNEKGSMLENNDKESEPEQENFISRFFKWLFNLFG